MRRVLVTGATGFVGRGTLQPLLDSGFEVHAVTSRVPASDGPEDVSWHQADLLDVATHVALLEAAAPTDLLHLAWYAEPGKFWDSPLNTAWVDASLALLRGFSAAGGQRAVIAGSCAEYRWEQTTHCVEDVTPLQPATLYGVSKNALYDAARTMAMDTGLSLAWGRIFFVYGPHEDRRRLAASIADSLLRGRRAETSHGLQQRDFLYAPELAEAFVALLHSDAAGAFNVASGTPVSIAEFATAIAEAARAPQLLALGARPATPGEPDVLTADVSRLREEVGWSPTLTLEEGVRLTVDWWRRAIAGAPRQERG